eukprot:SAG22_NODE_702_length_7784_cov_2.279896_3_plen_937_part_00
MLAFDQLGMGSRVYETVNVVGQHQDRGTSSAWYDRPSHAEWSQLGKMVFDVSSAVDFLVAPSTKRGHPFHSGNWSYPEINPAQVFTVGYGLGGTVGLYAAALDDRIAGAASICGFGSLRKATEGSRGGGLRRDFELHQLQPRLGFFASDPARLPYDVDDVLGLLLSQPSAAGKRRKAFVLSPQNDRINNVSEVEALVASLPSEALRGLTFVTPEGINRLDDSKQAAVVAWLQNVTTSDQSDVDGVAASFKTDDVLFASAGTFDAKSSLAKGQSKLQANAVDMTRVRNKTGFAEITTRAALGSQSIHQLKTDDYMNGMRGKAVRLHSLALFAALIRSGSSLTDQNDINALLRFRGFFNKQFPEWTNQTTNGRPADPCGNLTSRARRFSDPCRAVPTGGFIPAWEPGMPWMGVLNCTETEPRRVTALDLSCYSYISYNGAQVGSGCTRSNICQPGSKSSTRGSGPRTIFDEIGLLEELQWLDLSGNWLVSGPYCGLGSPCPEPLPKSFSRLRKLKELELGENQLATVPTALKGLISLQKLGLASQYPRESDLQGHTVLNYLQTLPDWFGSELLNLQVLDLGIGAHLNPERFGPWLQFDANPGCGSEPVQCSKNAPNDDRLIFNSPGRYHNDLGSLGSSFKDLDRLKLLDLTGNMRLFKAGSGATTSNVPAWFMRFSGNLVLWPPDFRPCSGDPHLRELISPPGHDPYATPSGSYTFTCACPERTYSASSAGTLRCGIEPHKSFNSTIDCRPCPDECAVCENGIATVRNGWRLPSVDATKLRRTLAVGAQRQQYALRCPGGGCGEFNLTTYPAANEHVLECKKHTAGHLCGRCLPNYSRQLESCVPCHPESHIRERFGVSSIFLTILVLLIAFVVATLVWQQRALIQRVKVEVSANLHIMLGLLQVISQHNCININDAVVTTDCPQCMTALPLPQVQPE